MKEPTIEEAIDILKSLVERMDRGEEITNEDLASAAIPQLLFSRDSNLKAASNALNELRPPRPPPEAPKPATQPQQPQNVTSQTTSALLGIARQYLAEYLELATIDQVEQVFVDLMKGETVQCPPKLREYLITNNLVRQTPNGISMW